MYAYQHLTRAQLRELRIELEHELAWLDRATNAEEEQDYSAPAPSDEDDASGHGGLAVALDGHTRTHSVQVKDALHRMANGEYGGCIRCGDRRSLSHDHHAFIKNDMLTMTQVRTLVRELSATKVLSVYLDTRAWSSRSPLHISKMRCSPKAAAGARLDGWRSRPRTAFTSPTSSRRERQRWPFGATGR